MLNISDRCYAVLYVSPECSRHHPNQHTVPSNLWHYGVTCHQQQGQHAVTEGSDQGQHLKAVRVKLLYGQEGEEEQVLHQVKRTQQACPDLLSSSHLPIGSSNYALKLISSDCIFHHACNMHSNMHCDFINQMEWSFMLCLYGISNHRREGRTKMMHAVCKSCGLVAGARIHDLAQEPTQAMPTLTATS